MNVNEKEYLSHFDGVKSIGNGKYKALCPAHPDKNPSLSITFLGGNSLPLLYCHCGCKYHDIIAAAGVKQSARGGWTFVCEYLYTPTLKKIRWLTSEGEKSFTWEHKKSEGSGWEKGAGGQAIPLYNLSALATAKQGDMVYVVEGEKDVDTLTKHGRIAICSPHGATKDDPKGKWKRSYTEMLKGYHIVIIQDNDEVGKAFAQAVAAELHGTAKSVRIIDLTLVWSDLKYHGDITDVFQMKRGNPDERK